MAIYADFNSTTPLDPKAAAAVGEALAVWGNPSSVHAEGRQAMALVTKARQLVADYCGVERDRVVFTSGGSEANSLALLGAYFSMPEFRLLTSTVEHSSILDAAHFLEKRCSVEYLPVDRSGVLALDRLVNGLTEYKPTLVSIMTANNETGVVFDIPAIAKACRKHGVLFHTDAVQALGKIEPSYWNLADLISISSHKIYGPKGVGALLVRSGVQLTQINFGGSQEIKRRGGTQNVAGIAGFGAAVGQLDKLNDTSKAGLLLRDRFESELKLALDGMYIQGALAKRICNTSNIRFDGVRSEVLLSALDLDGICVSAGAACSSGSLNPSHVLLAMGLPNTAARECLRFSFGRTTTTGDIDKIVERVVHHVRRIRSRTRL